MQQFIPYLSFDGNCREAMQFYERVFGGDIVAMLSFADVPGGGEMPGGSKDKIMHACLTLPDGNSLFAGDAPDHMPFEKQTGVMVTMSYPTVAAAQRVFDALCEGGTVTMPWEPTFWAKGFGMVTDRFGTAWGINGEQVPPPSQSY
jgi:PhnB protein